MSTVSWLLHWSDMEGLFTPLPVLSLFHHIASVMICVFCFFCLVSVLSLPHFCPTCSLTPLSHLCSLIVSCTHSLITLPTVFSLLKVSQHLSGPLFTSGCPPVVGAAWFWFPVHSVPSCFCQFLGFVFVVFFLREFAIRFRRAFCLATNLCLNLGPPSSHANAHTGTWRNREFPVAG